MALPLDLTTDALRDLLGGRFRADTPRGTWGFLRSPEHAGPEDVAILGSRVPLHRKRACRAGLRVVGSEQADSAGLEVESPDQALAVLVEELSKRAGATDAWMPQEVVVARFGEIARFARIHETARIGSGTRLGAGVVIHANVVIGQECVLGDHVVVGSEGFGLVPTDHRTWRTLPHRAGVVLGDDVQVGPQSNIAAGLIEPTRLGSGCRLDALIQIGHNAVLGPRCVLAGQSGVAGSAVLGADCLVGGQAAISDHVSLGDRCVVAARSGVTRGCGDAVVLKGFPARPVRGIGRGRAQECTPSE